MGSTESVTKRVTVEREEDDFRVRLCYCFLVSYLFNFWYFWYDFTKKDARQTYLSVYLGRRTAQNPVGYRQFMFASTWKIFMKFQPQYNITQQYNAIEYATIFINDYIEYLQQHFLCQRWRHQWRIYLR